jgi:hypothetical protein
VTFDLQTTKITDLINQPKSLKIATGKPDITTFEVKDGVWAGQDVKEKDGQITKKTMGGEPIKVKNQMTKTELKSLQGRGLQMSR